jgi:hypothetical protein
MWGNNCWIIKIKTQTQIRTNAKFLLKYGKDFRQNIIVVRIPLFPVKVKNVFLHERRLLKGMSGLFSGPARRDCGEYPAGYQKGGTFLKK